MRGGARARACVVSALFVILLASALAAPPAVVSSTFRKLDASLLRSSFTLVCPSSPHIRDFLSSLPGALTFQLSLVHFGGKEIFSSFGVSEITEDFRVTHCQNSFNSSLISF